MLYTLIFCGRTKSFGVCTAQCARLAVAVPDSAKQVAVYTIDRRRA